MLKNNINLKKIVKEKIQSKNLGVFDSGIGGLTVVNQIMQVLPRENIVYFGDTARVPYGAKSEKVIIDYSLQIANFLISKDIKMLVVACNTVTAVALDILKAKFDIPVIGVIEPGAKAATNNTKIKKIGVIGTITTIKSNAYSKEIKKINSSISVISKACPLFVPLVEEGWIDHQVTKIVATEYLMPLVDKGIDSIVLGCTHYPIIKKTIQSVIGSKIKIIDSAESTAIEIKSVLKEKKILNSLNQSPNHQFYVSDFPHKFDEIGTRFLGKKLENVKRVQL